MALIIEALTPSQADVVHLNKNPEEFAKLLAENRNAVIAAVRCEAVVPDFLNGESQMSANLSQ